jgi:glycosyltransferase involved in cell wall biosynthesis
VTTVGVVIPMYNRAHMIARAIESVLEQTRPADRIVVVDDGSTDDGAQRVLAFGDRVELIRQPNGGAAAARQRGVEALDTDWLAFLDSDDRFLPEHLERHLAAACELPEDVVWIFSDGWVEGRASERLPIIRNEVEWGGEDRLFDIAIETWYPVLRCYLQGSMLRRAALVRCGGFLPGMRSEDLLLAGRMETQGRFAYLAEPLWVYNDQAPETGERLSHGYLEDIDYHRARVLAFRECMNCERLAPHRDAYRPGYVSCLRAYAAAELRRGRRRTAIAHAWRAAQTGRDAKALLLAGLSTGGRTGYRLWDALHRANRRRHGASPTMGANAG